MFELLIYDFKKLLWQDELNPRVRCAFGNVFHIFFRTIHGVLAEILPPRIQLYIVSFIKCRVPRQISICLVDVDKTWDWAKPSHDLDKIPTSAEILLLRLPMFDTCYTVSNA